MSFINAIAGSPQKSEHHVLGEDITCEKFGLQPTQRTSGLDPHRGPSRVLDGP